MYVTVFSIVLSLLSCICLSGQDAENDMRKEIIGNISDFSLMGKHDSAVSVASSQFRSAVSGRDSVMALYAGVLAAQSWLFFEDMDSIGYYIRAVEPYVRDMRGHAVAKTIYCNVRGSYELRELNYTSALKYYLEGLSYAEEAGSLNNQVALLSNIVNIFYMQNNRKGMQYAERALELCSGESGASGYARSAAMIAMAQMLCLSGDNREAWYMLSRAEEEAVGSSAASNYFTIGILRARVLESGGKYADALDYYEKAMENISVTDPGTVSCGFLKWGNLLEKMGYRDPAMEKYRAGLEVSYKSGNVEYRRELLNSAAALSSVLGDEAAACRYSHSYRQLVESVEVRRNEFIDLIQDFQDMRHEREMLAKELDRQKSFIVMIISVCAAVVVTVFLLFLLLMYIRQKKLNALLIEQHRNYLHKKDFQNSASRPSGDRDGDRELFEKIDRQMREERLYARKDISLELLTEVMGVNRTYCSKAINAVAGMSFNRYVDSFRIEEAARRIVAGGGNVLFKQLADDLGYNSVTVFSKAFVREVGCSPSAYRNEVKKTPGGVEKSDNL